MHAFVLFSLWKKSHLEVSPAHCLPRKYFSSQGSPRDGEESSSHQGAGVPSPIWNETFRERLRPCFVAMSSPGYACLPVILFSYVQSKVCVPVILWRDWDSVSLLKTLFCVEPSKSTDLMCYIVDRVNMAICTLWLYIVSVNHCGYISCAWITLKNALVMVKSKYWLEKKDKRQKKSVI